jgi:hypothetical protein
MIGSAVCHDGRCQECQTYQKFTRLLDHANLHKGIRSEENTVAIVHA